MTYDEEEFGKYKQNYPKYLVLMCEHCLRPRKVDDLTVEVMQQGPFKGKRVARGPCRVCGKECIESITSDSEVRIVALRSQRYHERLKARRDKSTSTSHSKGKKKLATKTKKAKKSAESAEAKAKTTKAKAKTTKAKAPKSEKKAKAKTSSNGTRSRVYVRDEGDPTFQQALILAASGDLYTVEQIQERFEQAEKKGIVGTLNRPLEAADLTFMCGPRAGTVEIDGTEYEMFRSKDDEGNDVFGVPQHKDVLKKNAKPGKVTKKGSRLIFNGMTLVKKKSDLKN